MQFSHIWPCYSYLCACVCVCGKIRFVSRQKFSLSFPRRNVIFSAGADYIGTFHTEEAADTIAAVFGVCIYTYIIIVACFCLKKNTEINGLASARGRADICEQAGGSGRGGNGLLVLPLHAPPSTRYPFAPVSHLCVYRRIHSDVKLINCW